MRRRHTTLTGLRVAAGTGIGSEHHHRDIQGGLARAVVFGLSDGLVTNLAIILGVVGAHPSSSVVRLAGLAGLLAGSFSMAAGEYISMRAQAELLERELMMEAREIERRPDAERRELAMIYEKRGLDPEAAANLAATMMRDPLIALSTHAREELGINPANLGSPWQASIGSLVATALGSLVPLLPWLITSGGPAEIATIIASGVFAAAVGIALSRFTGRPWVFSAARQIAVCGASAAITFGVGSAMGAQSAGAAAPHDAVPGVGSSVRLSVSERAAYTGTAAPEADTGSPEISKPAPEFSVSVNASARPIATVNQNLIGVDGPGPSGAQRAVRAIGPHWIRTDVSFEGSIGGRSVYDCETGAWNPALLDKRIAAIRAEGGVPLEIVDYSPACLTPNPAATGAGNAPPDTGADEAKWNALVEKMAAHEIGQEGVRYFEVWNEPDWTFFSGGLNGYLQLYDDTSRALEAAAQKEHKRVYVGGPALADVVGTQDTTWLSALAGEVTRQHLPLDFVSWHNYVNDPYGGPITPGGPTFCWGRPPGPGSNPCFYNPGIDPGLIAHEADQARSVLSGDPALHPLLLVDEWNIDGNGDPRMDQPYDAAYVAAVLDSLQADRVSGACFFDVSNSPSNGDENWGMLFSDLKPKPVYEAFDYWHRLGSHQLAVSVQPGPGAPANSWASGKLGAVAAAGRRGTVSVLLYDFKPFDNSGNYGTADPTPYDRTVEFLAQGLTGRRYSYTLQGTDGSHPGGVLIEKGPATVSRRRTALSFTVSGEGVDLLTLEPH